MEKSHPHIIEYGYHYRAMLAAEDEKELEAVGKSIGKTVPDKHREYTWLKQEYRVRRDEIRVKAAEEAAKKAKEAANREAERVFN
jgi:hypothetical protein